MAGRASIVGAAETSVGKVREHNEDAHFIDPEAGIFVVCDGMGGHAAGEVASGIAVDVIREQWSSDAIQAVADRWLAQGTPDAHKQMIKAIQAGVIAAHDAIVAEAVADRSKTGMGTTLVGAMVVGGDVVFAQCGDSRAYLVRDAIAMQLTEDHTLLARLLAAGVEVDTSNEGARFKSMLTNALGIGPECKVSTFVVPVADGDRFLLCSDGITEYVEEAEIGEVLSTMPSPARSAQRLVELALQRGGGDNATALVVRVLEAGERARPSEMIRREEAAIGACPLWVNLSPQQRLRALRIALPRDHVAGERIPAVTLGDRVAWVIVEGEVEQDGYVLGPGALLYPEALLTDRPLPDKDGLAVPRNEVRALALRSDDFREVCDDDPDLGELLLAALGDVIAARRPKRRTGRIVVQPDPNATDWRGTTDPSIRAPTEPSAPPTHVITIPPLLSSLAPAKPPPRLHPRGSTPPTDRDLIVPAAARADADAALDRAMSNITVGRSPPALPDPIEEPDDQVGRAPTVQPTGQEDEQVIVVEADAPPPRQVATKPPVHAKPADHSEPEISIEAFAEEAPAREEPGTDDHEMTVSVDEPSEPEIVVMRSGRAITADDAPLAIGTIDTPPVPRRKRLTDDWE